MFPKGFQWIDDIRDKFESMCADVDEVVSSETSKYIEDLQTVGTNVKQFCSTADPLKYVEDQLQTVGTKVEELYSSVVPSSVDTLLSTINGIFPAQGPDSTTRGDETEVKDCQADLDDSKPELPAMPTETTDQIVSDLKPDSSIMDLGDDDSIINEEGKDFVVPDEPARVDSDEKTSSSYADESVTDEEIDAGFSSSGPAFDSSSSELEEITEADDKITQNNAQNAELSESYVVGDMNDGLPQESHDESPKKQSLRDAIRKRLHKMRSKSDDARSRLEMEPAKSLPDSWESEWEII
uniref:Uncharacterized protein n=1 Tax=Kalanchoe fedtschenkoi TaxID=63787 RepID=A0A7N0REU9_KALFE